MTTRLSDETIKLILGQCSYPNFSFILGHNTSDIDLDHPYLQVEFNAPCSKTGDIMGWKGRKWQLSRFMTKGEIVQTSLMAVLAAIEHEARENFKFNGQAIFGPHFDVDRLVTMASDPASIIERE